MDNTCPQAVMTLGELAAEVRAEGGEAARRACHGAPALVIRPRFPAAGEQHDLGTTLRWDLREVNLSETASGEGASPWLIVAQPESLVVPLVKSDRNPFLGVLAIGRGKTSDIQLLTGEVSKSHAIIRQGAAEWILQDAGSRNGTFLNGLRLDPRRDHPLKSGYEVRFADVQGMFLDTEGLVTLCSLVRG